MSVSSREAALFLVDCSTTMSRATAVVEGVGKHKSTLVAAPIDLAKRMISQKIGQRLLRELKTTPCGVLAFGYNKTKNVLTGQQKLSKQYDAEKDDFRYFYEVAPIDDCTSGTLEKVAEIEAGVGPDRKIEPGTETGIVRANDLYSALSVGIETMAAHTKSKEYKKEIWLFTDGEYGADWGTNLDGCIDRYTELKVSLHFVGLHFETDETEFLGFEVDPGTVKFENIQRLRYFVDGLNRREESYERNYGPRKRSNPSTFTTFARASTMLRMPAIKITNPTAHKTSLTFNDARGNIGRSLNIAVEIKKVVSSAPIKSMKSMSTASYVKITGKTAGTQFEKDLESQLRSTGGGSQVPQHVVNNDLVYALTRETGYYAIKPTGEFVSKKAEKGKGRGRDIETGVGEVVDVDDRIEKQKDDLDTVYFYGGTIVDTLRLQNGTGRLAGEIPGMEIVHFMKRSLVRWEHRIGDVQAVASPIGHVGAGRALSALIHAMIEEEAVAFVRYIKKETKNGVPAPQIGLLFPHIDEEGQEFCHWIQMPFAEDVRHYKFASMTNYFNVKGGRIESHPYLPTTEHIKAMDSFVDGMDLMDADVDDVGNPKPWYSKHDSFSPAIHNVNNALLFRISNMDDELPPPDPTLTKYLSPPELVLERSANAIIDIKRSFAIIKALAAPKKIYKNVFKYGNDYDLKSMFLTKRAGFVGSQPARPTPREREEDGFVFVDDEMVLSD